MPRAKGDKEYRLPNKGLNTEANVLDFPQDSAVDINNLELDFNPMRLRARLGQVSTNVTNETTIVGGATIYSYASSYFLWEGAGGDPDINFLCIQMQANLYFVDANSTNLDVLPISTYLSLLNVRSGTAKGGFTEAAETILQYSSIKGQLMITSSAIDPTLIRYNVDTSSVSYTKLSIKARDTVGLESEIAVNLRPIQTDFPVGSVFSVKYPEITEKHEYNLYNQGWYQARRKVAAAPLIDTIALTFSEISVYPSNSDISYLGVLESGGSLLYNSLTLEDQTFGDSLAPRGHFVLFAFDMDRELARGNLESGAYSGGGGENGGEFGSGWTDIPGTV